MEFGTYASCRPNLEGVTWFGKKLRNGIASQHVGPVFTKYWSVGTIKSKNMYWSGNVAPTGHET